MSEIKRALRFSLLAMGGCNISEMLASRIRYLHYYYFQIVCV